MLVNGGGVIINCSSIASTTALGGLALYSGRQGGGERAHPQRSGRVFRPGNAHGDDCPGVTEIELQQQSFAQMAPEVRAKLSASTPIRSVR